MNQLCACKRKAKGTIELWADESVSPAWSHKEWNRKPEAAGGAPATGRCGANPVLTRCTRNWPSFPFRITENQTQDPLLTSSRLVLATTSSPGWAGLLPGCSVPWGPCDEQPHPTAPWQGAAPSPPRASRPPPAVQNYPARSSTALSPLKSRAEATTHTLGFSTGYNPMTTEMIIEIPVIKLGTACLRHPCRPG